MLKELARGIACIFNPPKSPIVEALFSLGDAWQSVDWDRETQQRQISLLKLVLCGLAEQRLTITLVDDVCSPIMCVVAYGYGDSWLPAVKRAVEPRFRHVGRNHAGWETSKGVDFRRTEAGRQIVAEHRFANLEMLNNFHPAKWQIESEKVLWGQASATSAATAMAAASASVGDVNVTVNPHIVINQPAPLVNVKVMVPDRESSTSAPQKPSSISSPDQEFDAVTKALAILAESPPGVRIKEIAEAAGCTDKYLYAHPIFAPAWKAFKNVNERRSTIRRGSKSKDGTIEAIDEVEFDGS